MLTPEDLAEKKARALAATPGAWFQGRNYTEQVGIFRPDTESDGRTPDHVIDCPTGADAALIANAKGDILALVAEVERLTTELTALREKGQIV